ncbi:MAG: protein-L-isoaspartate(D-aspartate) O-methyltransferase [Thermoplasmata archaeon]
MRDPYSGRREDMVDRLKERGVLRTPKVIEAMQKVPRHLFVPRGMRESAYYDTPLGIGSGQTISAPHMVGMMLEYLEFHEGQKVLEVGGGSGYHAALAGHIVGPSGHVYSVERIPSLARRAIRNLEAGGLSDRVDVLLGDGSEGVPDHAPYDRIFITCAAPEIPPPLMEELDDGGKLLIPLGSRYYQDLILLEKQGDQIRRRSLGGCVFVPLIGKYGFS